MQVIFEPAQLHGTVRVPPSKSMSHRAILAAALANGTSVLRHLADSDDIRATMACAQALGADLRWQNGGLIIRGVEQTPPSATLDCNESGSTLRFLIPIAAALGIQATFTGRGKLPQRPITPYLEQFPPHGVRFNHCHTMPFTITGQLQSGRFVIPGDISSQFVTGLLYALPLLKQDSEIAIVGRLESKPYVDMTISVLQQFGIAIQTVSDRLYRIPGGQQYQPCHYAVEGDYSQAAFFLVAGACQGGLAVDGLKAGSAQGDRAILDLLMRCGCSITRQGETVSVAADRLCAFSADATDIPDLVPILSVLALHCHGKSVITGVRRLRIKESDRLAAVSEVFSALGGRLQADENQLTLYGPASLHGAEVDSHNDHRIAMATAIAALGAAGPVTLHTAESVKKSYPNFYQDYQQLGGKIHVILE